MGWSRRGLRQRWRRNAGLTGWRERGRERVLDAAVPQWQSVSECRCTHSELHLCLSPLGCWQEGVGGAKGNGRHQTPPVNTPGSLLWSATFISTQKVITRSYLQVYVNSILTRVALWLAKKHMRSLNLSDTVNSCTSG